MTKQKTYQGWQDQRTGDMYVTVNDSSLHHLGIHSKTGEWDYSDPGRADLAWSILTDYFNDKEQAFRFHQQFKQTFVTALDEWSWTLDGEQIENWLKQPLFKQQGFYSAESLDTSGTPAL